MEERDCSHLLKGRDPTIILKKALSILDSQVTKGDVSRQLKIISEYLFVSKQGFLIRDLCNVMHLFDLVRFRLLTEPEFEEILNKLLDLCSIPPMLTRSLEVLTYNMDLQEYFSWLGYMIVWFHDKKHLKKVTDAIYILLSQEYPQRHYVSLGIRKEAAHASKLADLLGDLLEVVEDDIYQQMLKVILVLIDGSKETCIQLLRKGLISTIIVRLEPTWRERFPSVKPNIPSGNEEAYYTEIIFHILTSLLRHANKNTMRAPTKFTLWSLQWAFRLFAMKESTNVERNNVLAVLLLLMDIYPDLLFGNLTFAYDIAMLAMSRDIVFHPNWTTDVKLTTSHEDHSCMALLLMCISFFPNLLSGPKVIEECRVVMGLMKLISHQQAIKWHQLQQCYLVRLSLNILHTIVPASTEEFIEDGGPLLVLQSLHHARENRKFYSYDIIYRSFELLEHLSYTFKSIRDSITYNGGVTCILQLCEQLLKESYIDEKNQALLAIGFFLLEHICTIDDAFQVLPSIISYMKRYVNPDQKELLQIPKLIIVCLSFVWNKITCSTVNSQAFLKMGGIYLMLDITQKACLPVKLVALGALIDLCEKVQCIPYLITWRNNEQGIKALLMEIFRQENEQLLVKTEKNGIMSDYRYPLMGKNQFYETYCMCKKQIGSPAIADMFVSCRPKVYCLLQILNYTQNETVEIVNEVYKIYSEDLSVRDKLTYILADNFLALKLGEEWNELQQDFVKMGFEPIPSDGVTLNAMTDITDKWAKDLQRMQDDILKNYRILQKKKEYTLYRTLREARLADAWDSLCQMKYIALCSERLFRVTSNLNLQSQIMKSLLVNEANGQMHRTFQSNISITCMHDQSISIPNEIQEDYETDTKPIIISPISSTFSTPRITFDEPKGEYLPDDLPKINESKMDQSPLKSTSYVFGKSNIAKLWDGK